MPRPGGAGGPPPWAGPAGPGLGPGVFEIWVTAAAKATALELGLITGDGRCFFDQISTPNW